MTGQQIDKYELTSLGKILALGFGNPSQWKLTDKGWCFPGEVSLETEEEECQMA
jgi:hypothetical protein